jgi:hypothetical protein
MSRATRDQQVKAAARSLLIAARVINIKHDALEGAKELETKTNRGVAKSLSVEPPPRPRPLFILPTNNNITRRLLRGLVHRPH